MHTLTGTVGALAAALLTYGVHSALLLGGAWLAHGLLGDTRNASREGAWRFALLGALLSAGIQLAFAVEPLAGRIELGGALPWLTFSPPQTAVGYTDGLELMSAPASPTGSLATPPRRAPRQQRERWPLARLVCLAWLPVAAILLLRLVRGHLSLRNLLHDRRPLEGRLRRRLDQLVAGAGISRPVSLSVSPRLPVPLALGLGRCEICLPAAALDALDVAEQDAVLAHELAHLARRDPQWLFLARLLESLFFFQPLQGVARRRLQDLAELRADDWAALALGDRLGLARCLSTVAGWQLSEGPAAAATPLAARRSQLRRRIDRLVAKGDPMPPRPSSPWVTAAGLLLVACSTVAAPSFSTSQAPPSPPAPTTTPSGEEAAPAPPLPPSQPSPPSSPIQPAASAPPSPASPAPLPPPPAGDGRAEKALHELDAALQAELATLEASMTEMEAMIEESLVPFQRELETRLEGLGEELESTLEPMLREMESNLEAAAAGSTSAMDQERAKRVREILAELASNLHGQIEVTLGRQGAMHEEIAAAIRATIHPPDQLALHEVARRLAQAHRTGELTEEERAALRADLSRVAEQSRPRPEEMEALRRRLESLKPTEEELRELRSVIAESASLARERLRHELETRPESTAERP